MLQKIHHVSHMGPRKMQDLLRQSGVKVRDGHQKVIDIISKCKACQLTNTVVNSKNPGTRLRGKKSRSYWEIDFTEIKPGKYGYKYMLVFIGTFQY